MPDKSEQFALRLPHPERPGPRSTGYSRPSALARWTAPQTISAGFLPNGASIDGAAVNASGIAWWFLTLSTPQVDLCERLLMPAMRSDRAVVDSLVFFEESLPRLRQRRYGRR
jgi:hypothetical protein